MNPFVFFVGCARSGTTLIQRIGDAHPQLAVLFEQRWLPRFWKRRIGIAPDGSVTEEFIDRLAENRRFRELELPIDQVRRLIASRPAKPYAQVVTELFDLYGQMKDKPHVGEKNPGYVRRLPVLNELWPDAKIVHVIRDGRDVALSLFEFSAAQDHVGRFPTWIDDRLTTAALYWEWSVRLGRESGTRLGSNRYLELRYEGLVDDPERECRKLCQFLALAYEPAMLRFYEAGRTQASRPERTRSRVGLPVTSGLRSWRTQMSPADLRRFEAASAPLLDELGYDRGAAGRSDEELAQAARIRAAFISSRPSLIPAAWQTDSVG